MVHLESIKTAVYKIYFTFRATLWIRACNREDLLSKPLESLHRDYKLCEKHFEAKYLSKTTNSRKRLIGEAIPTIFPHYRRCVHEDIGEYLVVVLTFSKTA